MRNTKLLPYETIVRVTNGEPEAVDEVISHYSRYIRYTALVGGKVNVDMEDYIKGKLIASLFKFRFDR